LILEASVAIQPNWWNVRVLKLATAGGVASAEAGDQDTNVVEQSEQPR
jgi:hypothetical protein